MTVLCLAELDGGQVADASLRALAFAGAMDLGPVIAAVFAPAGDVPAPALAGHGASGALAIESPMLAGYAPAAWARALVSLTASEGADAVVAASTGRGSEVMAHAGAIAGVPMAANCVSAQRLGDGSLGIVRQRWAGLLLEDAVLTASPALMTVAAEAPPAAPAEPASPVEVQVFHPDLGDDDLRVRATESRGHTGGASLATARVVVGGGRGVGGPAGFAPLEELADLLGGVVGVSRVVTSEGWRPHRQQVGQTGTRITPQVYLACGISGAIQHMAGCAGAKHIVAVNTDASAPIVSQADYAVIGDLKEVIPALVAAIRARAT